MLSIAIVGIAIILLLAFIFHNQIIRLIARFTQVLFFLGFFGLLSIAVLPDLYDKFTNNLLEESYLGIQFQTLDSSLNEIDKTKSNWQKEWNRIFSEKELNDTASEPYQIYDSFLTLLSTGLMIVIGVLSLFLMLLSIYFKYTFIGYIEVIDRIQKLEKITA
ncbi:MAG: hypothetical protein AAGA64_06360, partial [Bacteroidota bacterium]